MKDTFDKKRIVDCISAVETEIKTDPHHASPSLLVYKWVKEDKLNPIEFDAVIGYLVSNRLLDDILYPIIKLPVGV